MDRAEVDKLETAVEALNEGELEPFIALLDDDTGYGLGRDAVERRSADLSLAQVTEGVTAHLVVARDRHGGRSRLTSRG